MPLLDTLLTATCPTQHRPAGPADMSKPAPPSKFQAFTQKFVGGPKKRDVPPAPAPTGGPQIIKSPFDAFAAPPPNQGVAVPASIAMQSPAGTPGASASADATAGGATRAPGAAATSASGMGKRTSNMLNDLMGTFDELLVSKELEAVQEEAKASVYSESFKGRIPGTGFGSRSPV